MIKNLERYKKKSKYYRKYRQNNNFSFKNLKKESKKRNNKRSFKVETAHYPIIRDINI